MATSRLKRKLDLSDPTTKSSSSKYGDLTESFVSIGTALPSLVSSTTTKNNNKDSNEFKPLWEQEVFDEQGRKRLHGAFTGGFSAGYFNTVGSKEGWVPQKFKSTRKNKKEVGKGGDVVIGSLVDRAKELMDEEDLEEFNSSRKLEMSSEYTSRKKIKTTTEYDDDDPLMGLFGGLESNSNTLTPRQEQPPQQQDDRIFQGASSTSKIGSQLMKKMGWKPGQGCGPRLTFKQRKNQAKELGITLLSTDEDDRDHEDEVEDDHYYAPLDRPLILLKGKSSSQDRGAGLGYGTEETTLRSLVNQDQLSSQRRRMGENVNEDDLYSNYLEEDGTYLEDDYEMDTSFFGEKQKGKGQARRKEKEREPLVAFHDGVQVLKGFKLHFEPSTTTTSMSSHLPPTPPKGWKPNPSKIWNEDVLKTSTETIPSQGRGTSSRKENVQLSADQRGSLLGERLPTPPPKSVFEYLSTKDKDQLSDPTLLHLPPNPSSRTENQVSMGFTGRNNSSSSTATNSIPLGSRNRFTSATTTTPTSSASSSIFSQNNNKFHQPTPSTTEEDEPLRIPTLDPHIAKLALQGFQPYSTSSTSPDPVKQARYTLFLQFYASSNLDHHHYRGDEEFPFGPRSIPSSSNSQQREGSRTGEGGHSNEGLTSSSSSSASRLQTMKEFNKELNDYVDFAKVFKPVSKGMLGNRFTSGSLASANLVPSVQPGLWTPSPKPPPPPPTTTTTTTSTLSSSLGEGKDDKEEIEKLTPLQLAIKEDRFGLGTTRTIGVFRPDKLLCKRFGVQDPFHAQQVQKEGDSANGVGGEGYTKSDVGGKWGEPTSFDGFDQQGESGSSNVRGGGGNHHRVVDILGKDSMNQLRRIVDANAINNNLEEDDDDDDHKVELGGDGVDYIAQALSTKSNHQQSGSHGNGRKSFNIPSIENVGLGDDERQGEEILNYVKAPKDIFDAIFKESDDEDEDEEDDVREGLENYPLEGTKQIVDRTRPLSKPLKEDESMKPPPPPTTMQQPQTGPTLAETTLLLSSETIVDYKPTFLKPIKVSKGLAGGNAEQEKEKKKLKKKSKDKEKRKASTLSFDVEGDDGGEEEGQNGFKKREEEKKGVKKRKQSHSAQIKEGSLSSSKHDKAEEDDDDDEGWEEAAPVVHPSILGKYNGSATTNGPPLESSNGGGGKGIVSFEPVRRAKAADLF